MGLACSAVRPGVAGVGPPMPPPPASNGDLKGEPPSLCCRAEPLLRGLSASASSCEASPQW